jgi:hypothetical protein
MHASPACPRCAFRANGTTRSAMSAKGLMRCSKCGSTWRELGQSEQGSAGGEGSTSPALAATVKIRSAASAIGIQGTSLPHRVANTRFAKRSIGIVLASVTGFCIAFAAASMNREAASARAPLEITALSAESYDHDGRIAVRVEARLVNRSLDTIAVGDVTVTLSGGSGQWIYDWVFVPAVSHLAPGESIRFSTANGGVPLPASRVHLRHGPAVAAIAL